MSTYLEARDLPPGETRATIEFVDGFDSKSSLLHLREYAKPIILNQKTFLSMARDFGEGSSAKWTGRQVTLSTVGDDVSMKASIQPVPPPQNGAKPSDVASDLAAVLSRAITTTHDRNNMVSLLRGVADLLWARQ